MRGFRISLAAYTASVREAFSGISGFKYSGRWHSSGRHLDYAAESLSLATLERLVHYKRFDALAPHVLTEIEVPDSAIVILESPPLGWEDLDPPRSVRAVGDEWYDSLASPVLLVPSIVSKGERNLLINSRHPLWDWTWVKGGLAPFSFDGRLQELFKGK